MANIKNLYQFAEELREKVDIVEYLSQYLTIKKRGKNYVALCPFHPDKNPSLNISKEKGLFHCFGCGEGGNIYNFVMKIENVSFERAVEIVAKWANVEVPQFEYSEDKKKVFDIHEKLVEYFNKKLIENREILSYLFERGLDLESIEKFKLGFAPKSIVDFLDENKKEGIDIRDTGIFPYSHFVERIMFPIRNVSGKIVGFSGRAMKGEMPKYINSTEKFFKKGETLYGLYEGKEAILKTKEAILVEGYMDVIILSKNGIKNCVSSMGTSFTEDQAKILKRFSDRVIISFDPDIGGIEGTKRALEIAEKYNFEIKILSLPENLDPDEYVIKYGKDNLLNLISSSDDVISFLWNEAEKIHKNDKTLVPLLKDLVEIAKRIKDPAKRFEFIKKISERTKFPEIVILDEMKEKKKKIKEEIFEQENILEKEFLIYIIKNPELFEEIKNEIDENYFITEKYRELFMKITKGNEDLLINDPLYRELSLTEKDLGPKENFYDTLKRIKISYLLNLKKELLINLEKAEKNNEKDMVDYYQLKLIEIEKNIKNLLYKEV
ncbi:MAG: DNA primase [Caldisericia bacterium]|nr:DNA primase [Caldisericia bacterium]